MLRGTLVGLGIAALIASGICFVAGAYGAAFYLLISGIILTVGILFERWRYSRSATSPTGNWQTTGERFVDPTRGKLVEVLYNPDTGERDYQDKQG